MEAPFARMTSRTLRRPGRPAIAGAGESRSPVRAILRSPARPTTAAATGASRRFLGSYGRLAFVFAVGFLAQVELWLDATWAPAREELALVALAMTAILLLRLRAPVVTLVLETAGMTLATALSPVSNNDP